METIKLKLSTEEVIKMPGGIEAVKKILNKLKKKRHMISK